MRWLRIRCSDALRGVIRRRLVLAEAEERGVGGEELEAALCKICSVPIGLATYVPMAWTSLRLITS